MAILLQGDPNNPLGYNAGTTVLGQPYSTQGGGVTPDSNISFNVPIPAPVPVVPTAAPKPAAVAPRVPAPTFSGVVFYKPDQNSQQVFNAQGQALSYDQYIAQGGRADFSNVINGALPGQTAQPASQPTQTFGFGDGKSYDINGNQVQASQPAQGASPVPTTPPALPATDPNQTRIGELTKQVFQAPTINQQKLYEEAYNTAGLATVRTKLEDLNKIIADKLALYTSKEADINENPFLSEASRMGRISRLNDKKQAEIGNLQEQYKQYADLYNNGIAEVNKSVERQVGDYNTQRQISSEELNYLLGIQSTKAEQQTTAEKTAATFAEKNNITARFYKYPGNNTVYDSRTGQPLSFEQYKALGGAGVSGAAFPDVQTIQSELKTISEGQSLYDPITGQVIYTAPKTYKPGTGSGSVIGDLTTAQFNRLNTISDNARQDANIKDFPAVRASYETARSAASKSDGAGDIVLMRMIAKITDPTTGVREEEFQTFQSAQSTLARYGIQLTKQMWSGDRLTAAGRASLLQQATDIYSQRKAAYDTSVQFFTKQADSVAPGQGSSVIPYYVAPDNQPSGGSSVNLNDLF